MQGLVGAPLLGEDYVPDLFYLELSGEGGCLQIPRDLDNNLLTGIHEQDVGKRYPASLMSSDNILMLLVLS